MLTLLPSLPGGPIAALKLGFFLPGPSTLNTHCSQQADPRASTRRPYFSWAEFSTLIITCSTIDARRPNARPHSSPLVTTALPSFTTILLACFSSLRWAKGLPWARLRGTVIKGMLLQERTCLTVEGWTGSVYPKVREEKERERSNIILQ